VSRVRLARQVEVGLSILGEPFHPVKQEQACISSCASITCLCVDTKHEGRGGVDRRSAMGGVTSM
jgi:hypothetical protein